MAQIEPFAVEYERRMRALLEQTRTLVKEVQDLAADDAANQYGAQIDAAPDGAPVGDSTLPKEGAAAIRAVFGSFLAWLDAPLPAVGDATPAQLLRRRF